MKNLSNIILEQATTQVTTPESKINEIIENIQSFFDKARPDILVPILVVAIVLIGFLFGWFRGFTRNLIVLAGILVGLGIGIFVGPLVIESITTKILQAAGLNPTTHKAALDLGVQLILPIAVLVTSFSGYMTTGSITTLVRIFRRKKKLRRSIKRRLFMGIINGSIGAVMFVPGAFLFANVANVSKESDNEFTNTILNPAIKAITFGKGIGLGKNINQLKDLFNESRTLFSFFQNPGSFTEEDRNKIIDNAAKALNNPDLSPAVVATIGDYLRREVERSIEGDEQKMITNEKLNTALETDLDAVLIKDIPMTKYVSDLNIVNKLNDNGKSALNDLISKSIDAYSVEGVDPTLKTRVAEKVFNNLINSSSTPTSN